MIHYACEDLSERIRITSRNVKWIHTIHDKISTDEIQQILIKSASDLISLENPNYQYVAARLLLFSLRKSLHRDYGQDPPLLEHVKKCVEKGMCMIKIY